jgi:hypothetical protein
MIAGHRGGRATRRKSMNGLAQQQPATRCRGVSRLTLVHVKHLPLFRFVLYNSLH